MHRIIPALITVFSTIPFAYGAINFSDTFDSATVGNTPAGWTRTDISPAGDHSSIGVRQSGNNSGGVAVATMTGSGNFLNGGNSAIFSQELGTIVEGETYTFFVWARDAGSSYSISSSYLSTSISASAVTNAASTLGGFAAGTGQSSNGWSQYRVIYTGTAQTAGQPLYVNLQSSRGVSTSVRGWDDVSVTSVPEPSTYGLLAMPALAIAAVLRRRKREAA